MSDRLLRPGVKPVPIVVVILSFVAGLLLCWLLYSMAVTERAFLHDSVPVKGQVVELIARSSSGAHTNGTVYVPRFRFTDPQGTVVQSLIADGSNPPAWRVGETGQLLYNPAASPRIQVDSYLGRWGAVMLLTVVTLSFFMPGILGVRQRLKRPAP